jgi:peptidyl-prolyl cis-trans isomerase SurA
MTESLRWLLLAAALALAPAYAPAQTSRDGAAPRTADYIVAVVNQELVTNAEVEARLQQVRATAQRGGARLPPDGELRRQVIDALINERVLITHARDNGIRIDDADVDRAVANVAAQNQISLEQLREQLRRSGLDMARLRANLRDQMMVERVREREVASRIRITDAEIDALVDKQRNAAARVELNIAQILVPVPEGATNDETASRQARIEAALARIKAGEPFDAVAREVSEDANRQRGGEIGLKTVDRLPDLFVEAVKPLKAGEVAPSPLRSGAGFHLLKLLERKQASGFTTTQTRARHILLRPSAQVTPQAAAARLTEFKRLVESGARTFEPLARENSEDASAAGGGDLGWAAPGSFVPEFEQAMNALPVGGISAPVSSRFGLHLIQVVDRRDVSLDLKQVREQARNALREQKFEDAYAEWARELRARAYIEMREPPSQ